MGDSSEVRVCLKDRKLNYLNDVAKKPRLDIEFQDLTYSVKDFSVKGGWRHILKSISGKFSSGEFTAIMGPSGAGKSTLLNILAGYLTSGTKGDITINGLPRTMATFKKMASYILQENIIQPFLTVQESMIYAASLKLSHVKHEDKVAVIEEIVDFLGLGECTNTRAEYLSGGQKKRLTIALELVSNPPVVFLDEPTTGLDDYAVKQCIDLLKKISNLDRTVICTIHQPSSSLFQYFDQVYIMAEGCCVYNGTPEQMVPFFTSTGYDCPSNYTPADYMIELVNLYPSTVDIFTRASYNGKSNIKESLRREDDVVSVKIDENRSFFRQLSLLLSRRFLQMRRNRAGIFLQIIHHVFSALLISGIFFGIGNDASQTFTIFKFCLCCNVFFSYTYVMGPVVIYPFEVKLLQTEYFNRWYSFKAYYFALTIAALPILVIFSIIYSVIVYYYTDHPVESNRLIGFTMINLMVALTSQGLGYFIGSAFSVTKGAVVGPLVLASSLVLSVYGVGRDGLVPFYDFMKNLTFIRDGVVGLCSTLFYDRKPLFCKDLYCHFKKPDVLMKENSMPLTHYSYHMVNLCIFFVVFRIMWYFMLKCRLNLELSCRIKSFVKRIMSVTKLFS